MDRIIITTENIKNNINTTYYKRGLEYYSYGKVIECKSFMEVDEYGDESTVIVGKVLGSSHKPYEQNIEIYEDEDFDIVIAGTCSCPVTYNCKHIAAVCITYKSDMMSIQRRELSKIGHLKNSDDFMLQKWLLDVNNSQKKSSSLEKEDYFLTYRLDGAKSYDKGKVAIFKSKRLKNGSISRGTKLDNYKVLHSYSYRELKVTEDEDILQLLRVFVSEDYYSTMNKLSGSLGNILVKKIVATGRAYFEYNQKAIDFIEAPFQTDFSLKLYKGNYTFKSNLSAKEQRVFETEPPLVLNTLNNTLQELDISLENYILMNKAPKIPKEGVSDVLEIVAKKIPSLKLQTPKGIKVQKISTIPIPTLHLKANNSFVVDFSYEKYSVKYMPQLEFSSFYESGEKVEIERKLLFEANCKKTIEDFGFEVKIVEENLSVILEKSNRQAQLQLWSDFLESGLEKLRSEGWEIVQDEAFSLKFESDSEVVVESEASNNWFDLSFNLEFDGHSQAIAPLVSTIISEFDDISSMPEIINVEVSENHFVSIETKQIEPILKTIIELFDKKQGDDSLKISPYDAHLVDFMDDDVIWRGSREILELSQKLKDFKGIKEAKPPKALNATLREYQQEGLNWLNFLHEFKFGGILADDMGLGKTIQTLAHLSRLKEQDKLQKPSLIVMPTSLVANWKNEAKKFTPNLSVLILHGNERAKYFDEIGNYDIVLTTYALVTRDEEVLLKHSFSYIILDEAQKIKNPKTKMAIAIKKLHSEYRLALSGTPIENHLGELWSIFSFLMPGFLDTLSFFRNYYQTPIEKEHNFERQNLLNKRLKPFMIRRTKEIVADELPAKSEIIKYTQFDAKQSKLYESIRVTMEKKVQDAVKEKGIGSSHITILDALLKLRQVCCDPSLLKISEAQKVKESAKLELFLDLIDELMQEGRKVLVFSQFTSMLAILEEQIIAKNISYSKLTGSTIKREEAIEKFTEGNASIFLISLKAGGVGLNLVAADTVIHYDPWWNPAVENQATDRAYRIGQTKAVFVYKLIIENSIEQKILELQKKKQAIQESVYDENRQQDDIKFSGNELLELLK